MWYAGLLPSSVFAVFTTCRSLVANLGSRLNRHPSVEPFPIKSLAMQAEFNLRWRCWPLFVLLATLSSASANYVGIEQEVAEMQASSHNLRN